MQLYFRGNGKISVEGNFSLGRIFYEKRGGGGGREEADFLFDREGSFSITLIIRRGFAIQSNRFSNSNTGNNKIYLKAIIVVR